MTTSTHASVSILIGADLGKSFKDSFGSANKQLSALGDVIKKVNDKVSQIESFKKSTRATKEAAIAYKQARQNLNILSKEIAAYDYPSKSLQNNFRKVELAARNAKTAFIEQARATREIGKALKESGVDFKNFNKQQEALSKNLVAFKSSQLAIQNNSNAKAQNLNNRANYRSQMVDAVALGGTLYKIVKPAVDFEFAMARVGAVTEEAANSDGFKKLTDKAKELGRTTQYTSADAAKAMQFLGMAGYTTNQILAATPAILNLAISDNMELGESAEIVANILNGFGMKAEEAGKAADILAQTSVATSTNVRTLGETMKFVAPAAAAVGGTLEETAALAGVLGNAGIDASMAGTMMRSAYLRLAAPAKAGATALGKLRDEMQISAEEMPDVAKEALLAQTRLQGLGVKIFTSAGKMRSMVEILRDLHKATKNLSDEKRLGAVKDIFGTYATSGALNIFKAFDKGTNETGSVDYVLDQIKNSAGTAQNIANRLNDTATGAFRELDSSVESIGISLGNTLLPAISSTARGIAAFASGVSALAERFPVITKVIGITITSLIALKIATIVLGYAFTFLKGGVLAVQGAFLVLRARMLLLGLAMPAVTTAIRAMSIALISSPITWVVAGIATAAFLLIRNWKPVGEFFKNLFGGVIDWVKSAFAWISKLLAPLKFVINAVSNTTGKAWNSLFGDNGQSLSSKPSTQKLQSSLGDVAGIFGTNSKETENFSPIETDKISGNSRSQINISAPITINNNGNRNLDERKIASQVQAAIDETFRKLSARKLALNYD